MTRFIALSAILLLAGCATGAGDSRLDRPEVTDQVRRLSCYQGEDFRSRIGTSPRAVAPDGRRSAWAEVRSIASQPGDETTRACRNISRLWLEEVGEAPRLIFEQNPGAEGRNGNSIMPIAWSEDGGRLLFELDTWTYYTDRDPPILAIWNRATEEIEQISVAAAIQARSGDCAFQMRAHGFASDGRVRVTTAPMPLDEARGLPPCSSSSESWFVASDGSMEIAAN